MHNVTYIARVDAWAAGYFLDGAFHGGLVAARADAGAVANAENMGVHRLGRHAEPHIQHHIGGFAPDPWQRHQRRAR